MISFALFNNKIYPYMKNNFFIIKSLKVGQITSCRGFRVVYVRFVAKAYALLFVEKRPKNNYDKH